MFGSVAKSWFARKLGVERSKLFCVSVMPCPGGCVGGGGQPIPAEDEERYGVRGERLYQLDRENPLRFSHENPEVQRLYAEYLGAPLSEKAEDLLHTDHNGWNMALTIKGFPKR